MSDKILLVDDVKINRLMMENILSKSENDYVFIHSKNGEEAQKILNSQAIDLVILDLLMPVLDGYSLLEWMKSDEVLKHIPVIVYTATHDLASIATVLEKGALDYFFKPLSQMEVKVIVPYKVKNALKAYHEKKTKKVGGSHWKQVVHQHQGFEVSTHALANDVHFITYQTNEQMAFIYFDYSASNSERLIEPLIKACFLKVVQNQKEPSRLLKEMVRVVEPLVCIFDLNQLGILVGTIDDGKMQFVTYGEITAYLYNQKGKAEAMISNFKDCKSIPFGEGDGLLCISKNLNYALNHCVAEKNNWVYPLVTYFKKNSFSYQLMNEVFNKSYKYAETDVCDNVEIAIIEGVASNENV